MIKVGVVGVGYLGRYHAEKYAAMSGVRLVGLSDVDVLKAGPVADKLGVKFFPDYRAMLDQVDAVSIVVPTASHYKVAREFLAAGAHVLVEKPITRTLEEADTLIRLAREAGLVLQVGHLERFNAAQTAAAPYIEAPLFIEASRLNRFPARGLDVDVVLDLMIHDLDIILHLVGQPPVSIQAVGVPVLTDKVDIANARLEFPTGCVANVTASRISGKSLRKIRIFQKHLYISIDYGQAQVALARRAPGSSSHPEIKPELLEVAPGDSLESELRAFIDAVRTGSDPRVSGEDGRRALGLAIAVMEAIAAHPETRLDDFRPDRDKV